MPNSITNSQQGIWYSQRINPASKANYLPHVFEISGSIDPELFKKAFGVLINQNDSLRSIFLENDSHKVEQHIVSEIEFNLPFIDLTNKYERADDLIQKRIEKGLDISSSSFDSLLIKSDDSVFKWYLNIHHIVADATTFKVLFDEMAQIYFFMEEGKVPDPPEADLKTSFGEYQRFEAESQKKTEEPAFLYWKKKEKKPVGQPKLFGNKRKKNSDKSRRIKVNFSSLQKKVFDKLIENEHYRSLNQDLTRFSIWATLFTVFIARLSGENRIRIGTPFPNRNIPRFKRTSGLLIEVLPIDIHVEDDDTFSSLFQKVRKELYALFQNGYPGAQTLENARGIHFIINYIPLYFGDFGRFSAKADWLFPNQLDQNHQLRLQLFDFNVDKEVEQFLDINEAYFNDDQLDKLPDYFKLIAEGCMVNDQTPVNQLPVVTLAERTQLIGEGKAKNRKELNQVDFDSLIWKSTQSPEDIAIKNGDLEYSYAQLHNLVNEIAQKLSSKGIVKGSRIIVHLPRSVEYIATILAILNLKATFIPVPVDFPPKRLDFVVEDVNPDLIISSDAHSMGIPTMEIGLDQFELKDYKNLISSTKETTNNYPVYILYTSGSTGRPKGVEVNIGSLINYLLEARDSYSIDSFKMPFFTSIGFDLTMTSIFLPLISGGTIYLHEEDETGPDLAVLEAISNPEINAIKLTPSHARLVNEKPKSESEIQVVIFGGENLDTKLAKRLKDLLPESAAIYNEYGPTEATVGCIIHEWDPNNEEEGSVSIGRPIRGCSTYILDSNLNPVPHGVPGELFLGGQVLANGYWNNSEKTTIVFLENPFEEGQKIYRTGDVVRLNEHNDFEYLGRADDQIKLNGVRIEASELEGLLNSFPQIEEAYITSVSSDVDFFQPPESYCEKCGIPSNYPDIKFNEAGVCQLCESYEDYKRNVSTYFRSMGELRAQIKDLNDNDSEYDCLMLLSGGKDSSYALGRLVEMELKVLAFTLDNGFISEGAKKNINNTVKKLGVDHIYGTTEAMNEIFRDSLARHHNVCNGCFKTLYTLSTRLALDKKIPVIVTGLSRGQFFETRLTEELFHKDSFDPSDIDDVILQARKSYHRTQDAVNNNLDVSMFESDEVFEKVSFLDFYRFCDVSLSEMIQYLEETIGWIRPDDTGRSTNCVINDLGIYMHKRKKGYHNYAFPYSWDVRVGHKTREETIHELNDELSSEEIQQLMVDIGLSTEPKQEIVVYYKSAKPINPEKLIEYLKEHLQASMIPSVFQHVDSFPLTPNGKIDKKALVKVRSEDRRFGSEEIISPANKIEQLVHDVWCEVLKMDRMSVADSFIALGGNSLNAIKIVAQLNQKINMEISIQEFFQMNTIRNLSSHIEKRMREEMANRIGIK